MVLPLPGSASVYPTEAVTAAKYKELLEADGISFKSGGDQVDRDFRPPGDYRLVVASVSDLTWRLIKYDDDDAPLIEVSKAIVELTATCHAHSAPQTDLHARPRWTAR